MKHDSRLDSPRQIEPHEIASLFHRHCLVGAAPMPSGTVASIRLADAASRPAATDALARLPFTIEFE